MLQHGTGTCQQPVPLGVGVPIVPLPAQNRGIASAACVVGYPVQCHGGQLYVTGQPVSTSAPHIRHAEGVKAEQALNDAHLRLHG